MMLFWIGLGIGFTAGWGLAYCFAYSLIRTTKQVTLDMHELSKRKW